MIEINEDAFYTAKEIAELAQKNVRTVRGWFRSGKLAGKKIGREWIASGTNLKKFFEGGE